MNHILGIFVLSSSCNLFFHRHKDPFYNEIGGFDSLRIPLIKPYFMAYLSKETSWDLELQADPPSENTYYYLTLHDIRKFAVENGIIMVYTPYVESNINESIGQRVFHWFVIMPSSNLEEGFEDEEAFNNYIQEFNIPEPNWITPNEAYEQFSETGCLDWITGCK